MKYLLTAEAARLIGITPNGVRVMEQRGALRAQRTDSGVRLFDRSLVERVARERAHRLRIGRPLGDRRPSADIHAARG